MVRNAARGAPITLPEGGTFSTVKGLTDHVRQLISRYAVGEEFESQDLSELFANNHYVCFAHGLRPTRFAKHKSPEGAPYQFWALFPDGKWRTTSWLNAIAPPRTLEWRTRQYLREFVHLMYGQDKALTCVWIQRTDIKHAKELDLAHVGPTFDQMCRFVLPLYTKAERESWPWVSLIDRDRLAINPENAWLPLTHPVVQEFAKLHLIARTLTLCRRCHALLDGRSIAKEQQSFKRLTISP